MTYESRLIDRPVGEQPWQDSLQARDNLRLAVGVTGGYADAPLPVLTESPPLIADG